MNASKRPRRPRSAQASIAAAGALVVACGVSRASRPAPSTAASPLTLPTSAAPRPRAARAPATVVRALTVGAEARGSNSFVCEHVVGGPAWCSGNNAYGQLGAARRRFEAPAWERVDVPARVRALVAGNTHACALLDDGKVRCWGQNDAAELGVRGGDEPCLTSSAGSAPSTCRFTPVAVPSLPLIESLGLGEEYSCALARDQRVFCWGGAMPAFAEGPAPHAVPGVDDAREMVVGGRAACVRRASGAVTCWGRMDWGSHPADGQVAGNDPRDVPGVRDVRQLAMGGGLVCALRAGGSVVCWGLRAPSAPREVPGVTGATRIAVGGHTACALVAERRLLCWGMRVNAHGDRPSRHLLGVVEVAHARGAEDIAMAGLRACVHRAGRVHCWGGRDFLASPGELPLPE